VRRGEGDFIDEKRKGVGRKEGNRKLLVLTSREKNGGATKESIKERERSLTRLPTFRMRKTTIKKGGRRSLAGGTGCLLTRVAILGEDRKAKKKVGKRKGAVTTLRHRENAKVRLGVLDARD